MKRKLYHLAVVYFVVAAATVLAQEPQTNPASALPAAAASEIECSGFISGAPVPRDLQIRGGADNDFIEPARLFRTGDFVYLSGPSAKGITAAAEYRLVRPATERVRTLHQTPLPALLGRTTWYPGQRWSIHSLGHPYEDVGRVKVAAVRNEGAVAEVTFACGPVSLMDIAIPYQPRPIPEYKPAEKFDRFAIPNGRPLGAITAAAFNAGAVGVGKMVYVNLGEQDGVRPGNRFRIFHFSRDVLQQGILGPPDLPRESVGELVVLTTQEKSSVGIVVISVRDISLGDGIELE